MIVVDSSVWIAQLCGNDIATIERLKNINDTKEILVGDLILLEVLQGARSEPEALLIEKGLRQFPVQQMLSDRLLAKAAGNYRELRKRGITVRNTVDVVIGTFCIEENHSLLHNNRDFDPIAKYLGLMVA
ncbi:type II toxin-antitoxin system VapC family toxin [Rhizobium sp. HT1-10]|uniref:type II toxin-antitoxin system VapC family toxin n=1 Tax=Rhizobium sp. HT1-10 TaxID=3111638 RepID=UPI003C21DA73